MLKILLVLLVSTSLLACSSAEKPLTTPTETPSQALICAQNLAKEIGVNPVPYATITAGIYGDAICRMGCDTARQMIASLPTAQQQSAGNLSLCPKQ